MERYLWSCRLPCGLFVVRHKHSLTTHRRDDDSVDLFSCSARRPPAAGGGGGCARRVEALGAGRIGAPDICAALPEPERCYDWSMAAS